VASASRDRDYHVRARGTVEHGESMAIEGGCAGRGAMDDGGSRHHSQGERRARAKAACTGSTMGEPTFGAQDEAAAIPGDQGREMEFPIVDGGRWHQARHSCAGSFWVKIGAVVGIAGRTRCIWTFRGRRATADLDGRDYAGTPSQSCSRGGGKVGKFCIRVRPEGLGADRGLRVGGYVSAEGSGQPVRWCVSSGR